MRNERRDLQDGALHPVLRVDALIDDILHRRWKDVDRRARVGRRRRERHADLLGTNREVDFLPDLELLVVERLDLWETLGLNEAVVAVHRDDLAVEEVRVADERGDEARGRRLVDARRAVELLDPALVDDRDAIRERHRLALVVRNVHKRDTDPIVNRVEFEKHVLTELEVKRRERLVQEEHLRTVHERPRDRDTLLLSARELVRILPRVFGELDHLQDRVDLLLDLLLVDLRELQRERDIVPDRHRREERVVLEDRMDAALVWR